LGTRAYIAPFDDPQIGQFARNWYAAREANAERAREGAEHLVQAVHRDRDTLRVARVPNLLTMMALIHRNRATLPNGKALLYEDIAQAYLKTIDEFRQIAEFTDSLQDIKRWLGEVGFKMQQQRWEDREAGQAVMIGGDTFRSWLAEAMAGTGKPTTMDDVRGFLDSIKRRSGLMIERGDDQFAFTHRSFQEYFAAVYLADWVTSAEWLMGEEVPPGTAAADLQRYAADTAWKETLVFLFELLAGEKPLGKKKVREAVFGSDWSGVTGRHGDWPQTAGLLARLTSDPHVNWDLDTQASAVDRCLTVAAGYHQTDDERDLDMVPIVLGPLLSGEPAIVHQRFQWLADQWASAGIPRLNIDRTWVSDLSPLARLTALQHLSIELTAVSDLSPLARLTGLTTLQLRPTRPIDLSPLVALTRLRDVYLWFEDEVIDLSPLARLTELTTLMLAGRGVTDPLPLAGLTRLTMLSLTGSQVANLSPLVGLAELQQLNLSYTLVVDLSPLTRLTKLQHLFLDGTPVVDLAPLAELIGLTTLSLKHTRVTGDEVANLKARFPRLKVLE
jgi:hypothetical protein